VCFARVAFVVTRYSEPVFESSPSYNIHSQLFPPGADEEHTVAMNPAHWLRLKAEELRGMAGQLLDFARDYDRLADDLAIVSRTGAGEERQRPVALQVHELDVNAVKMRAEVRHCVASHGRWTTKLRRRCAKPPTRWKRGLSRSNSVKQSSGACDCTKATRIGGHGGERVTLSEPPGYVR
jgi:hypothetical protein